jgi:hypothetical protein
MGGRVYDPVLGRFLSADPFIQDPFGTQAFNRYSYVLNNPLSFTDPSGFFFSKLFKGAGNLLSAAFKPFVHAVKNPEVLVRAGAGAYACYAGGPYVCAGYAVISTATQGGSVGDSLLAAALVLGSHYGGQALAASAAEPGSLSVGYVEGGGGSVGAEDGGGGLGNLIGNLAGAIITESANSAKFDNGAKTRSFGNLYTPAGTASGTSMMGMFDVPDAPTGGGPSGLELFLDNNVVLVGALLIDIANTPFSPGPDVTLLALGAWQGTKVVRGAAKFASVGATKLPRFLRNKLKRIENKIAAGGLRGVSGTVTEKEAILLGERFVGSGFRVSTMRGGINQLISRDGLRRFRFPSGKMGINRLTGEPFSRTGVQANFESRLIPGGRFTNNVHLDVIP